MSYYQLCLYSEIQYATNMFSLAINGSIVQMHLEYMTTLLDT